MRQTATRTNTNSPNTPAWIGRLPANKPAEFAEIGLTK